MKIFMRKTYITRKEMPGQDRPGTDLEAMSYRGIRYRKIIRQSVRHKSSIATKKRLFELNRVGAVGFETTPALKKHDQKGNIQKNQEPS